MNRATKRGPEHAVADPGPLFRRACALLAAGDAAAMEVLPACERHPGYAPGWRALGAMLLRTGQPAAAAVAFQRGGEAANAAFARGLVCQEARDCAGAAAAYRAALKARPGFHEAALNLGVVLQEAGDLEAALDAYATALDLAPGSFGRIAQALCCGPTGCLYLNPEALRAELQARGAR